MNTERERFEEWLYKVGYLANKRPDGDTYVFAGANAAWLAWQAQAAIIAERDAEIAAHKDRFTLLGNAIQAAKYELSFAGKCEQVTKAMDVLNSVYKIQHPELDKALGDNHE